MKKVRSLIFIAAMLSTLGLICCVGEDGECAGCDSDAEWSKYGSSKCYFSQEECEAIEKEECTVCT